MHKLAAMVPIMEAACDSSCKRLARFFKPKSAPVIRVIALLIASPTWRSRTRRSTRPWAPWR
eukprot:18727-Prymnesium_polylepis.1